jgi:hypothetical protein
MLGPMSLRGLPFLLGGVCVAGSAFAQTRPLLTEEASTAPSGTVVLEAGADFIRAEPSFVTGNERDRYDVPVLRVVCSPADNVEVDVEWTGRILVRNDPDFGRASDVGDVVLRTKVRLLEERLGRPAFGVRLVVALPETKPTKGLGPNTIRMAAQFLLTKTLGRTKLHADAGLAIEDKPLSLHAQSDFLAYGLALEQSVSSRVALVAEVAGRGVGKGVPGADQRAEARAGFRISTGRLRWDAGLRRGLAAADGTWGVTAGMSWKVR